MSLSIPKNIPILLLFVLALTSCKNFGLLMQVTTLPLKKMKFFLLQQFPVSQVHGIEKQLAVLMYGQVLAEQFCLASLQ
jgi:hypothetical protein